MNSFFASLLPKAAAPAKKAATKKRGRGKVKSKKGTKEESKPVDEAELMKNLNIELQKRFEGIVADIEVKQEKLDKIIIEAAESTAGGKKKKGKKGKAKGAELKAKVSTDLLKVKKDTDAVQLNDCSVKKIWTARKTLSKYKMLQIINPEVEDVTEIPLNDGPLAFMYDQVFSMQIVDSDVDKENKKRNMMIFFYGKWATQMSEIVARGDQISITVPSPNIQANDPKDKADKDENSICIAIGGETTVDFSNGGEEDKENTKKSKKKRGGKKSKEPEVMTFSLDNDVQIKVVSFPREGASGATARAVEIGIDSETVGTIEKQQFDEINPFNQKKRSIPIVDKEFNKKAKISKYEYSDLKEVVKLALNKKLTKEEKRVDVYGVVVSFAPPRQTIRGDWLSPVTLTDDSLENGKVVMNVFNADPTKLPTYTQIGDVIRCHRVHAQVYEYEVDGPAPKKGGKPKKVTVRQPQLVSNKASSFVVVSRRDDGKSLKDTLKAIKKEKNGLKESEWSVISTSKLTFTFTDKDAVRARKLWAWGYQSFSEGATIIRNKDEPDATFTISQMTEDIDAPSAAYPHTVKGDLTCLVCAVISIPLAEKTAKQPFGFLRVWDGTGAPKSDPLPMDSHAAQYAVSTGDPGQACMNSIKKVVDALPKKTPVPPSLCGRVVNVAVWEAAHWEYISNGWMAGPPVKAGNWIRVRNVWDGSMGSDGLAIRMIHMGDKAGMTPLSDSVFEIKELVIAHNKRVADKDKFNPNSCVYGENTAATSGGKKGRKGRKGKKGAVHCLAEVLGEPAPSKFTVTARIVATYPSIDLDGKGGNLEKLCVMSVPNKKEKKSKATYQFAIQLEDNTAELSAIISGDTAEGIVGVSADKIMGGKKAAKTKKEVLANLRGVIDESSEFEIELESFMQDGEKFFGVKLGSEVALVKK